MANSKRQSAVKFVVRVKFVQRVKFVVRVHTCRAYVHVRHKSSSHHHEYREQFRKHVFADARRVHAFSFK